MSENELAFLGQVWVKKSVADNLQNQLNNAQNKLNQLVGTYSMYSENDYNDTGFSASFTISEDGNVTPNSASTRVGDVAFLTIKKNH